jgi:carbamate kinase
MEPRIVVALGGNALGNTAEEQQARIAECAGALVDLIVGGWEIIVTHGNGPQVGMTHLAFSEGAKQTDRIAPMPLGECTAMSQGYIGYHLQAGLSRELRRRGMPWQVSTVVTRVEVSREDPAFLHPAKPIGSFYTKQEAMKMTQADPSLHFTEDAGRGYRRVVASPKPQHIVELRSIRNLLDNEFVVIACGGGGIPVIKQAPGDYVGVEAVIDKDLAAEKLAEEIGADALFILTAVDRVCLHYGTPKEQKLAHLTTQEAERYCAEGHFAPGSMLPKVQAAIAFAKSAPGRRAVIASLDNAAKAMSGESGTVIGGEPGTHGMYAACSFESQ